MLIIINHINYVFLKLQILQFLKIHEFIRWK